MNKRQSSQCLVKKTKAEEETREGRNERKKGGKMRKLVI